MNPEDFARGNTKLAEVKEVAEQLFDDLAFRSELGSPIHQINEVRFGTDRGLWFELWSKEESGKILLAHRTSMDSDQLLVRAQYVLSPDEIELVWNKGAYQGAHNYSEGEFAEPRPEFLEAILKGLKELAAKWQVSPVVKLMIRANQVLTIIRLPIMFFDKDCIEYDCAAPPAREEPYYQYSGEDGGYIEARQNGILGLVKLKVVAPDGSVFIHDPSGQYLEREDPEATRWGNLALRSQLESVNFR